MGKMGKRERRKAKGGRRKAKVGRRKAGMAHGTHELHGKERGEGGGKCRWNGGLTTKYTKDTKRRGVMRVACEMGLVTGEE